MTLSLLQTKLYAPLPRLDLVARPQLLAKLSRGGRCPLVFIAAPAGFGKTTLVSAWIAQTKQAVAWLTLDEEDNDPLRFLHYLIAALQTHQPTLGRTALPLLAAPQSPPLRAMFTLLLNDLKTLTAPLALVLDDYHLLSALPIHEAIAFFIDHLPPACQLIITSRNDPPLPLPRWRVRNQLTEIRAEDLRFTPDEATSFLNECRGLNLTSQEIVTLAARTEGWIAGLQLAALSLQGCNDRANFIANFTGSHAYIIDYLVEEVLQHQPPATQDFLLQTALLERLCGALCDALTGRNDGQLLLEQLQRANLFLLPLDEQRQWYRYHQLFAQVLRHRLALTYPDRVALLQQRASAWYEQAQEIDAAIHHAHLGGDHERVATLIETHALPLLEREEIMTVRSWLATLPREVIQARLLLTLIEGTIVVLTGQLDQATHFFATTEPRFMDATCPRPLYGVWAQLRALLARYQGEVGNIIEYAHEALDALPSTVPPTWGMARSHALINLGLAQAMIGDNDAAQHAFLAAAAEGHAAQSITTYAALIGLGWQQTQLGKLTQARQTYGQIIEQTSRLPGRTAPMLGMAYVGLAYLLYERNELAGAREAALRGIEYLRGSVEQVILAIGYGTLARLYIAAGDEPQALATLGQAESWLTQMQITDMGFRHALAAYRTLLWLEQGNLDPALAWAATTAQRVDPNPFSTLPWEKLVLIRVWLTTTEPMLALAVIDELSTVVATRQWTQWLIALHALRALAYQQQGDGAAAAQRLHQALTLAQPQGFIRTFVDLGEGMRSLLMALHPTVLDAGLKSYIARLLAAFSSSPAHASVPPVKTQAPPPTPNRQNLIEPLSARELEILRLVNDGLSNSEIADKIIVTVGTVKKHLNNIFGKLGAGSRTQALVRAREVKLLE